MTETRDKVTTPEFRVSFPAIFDPEKFEEGSDPKYAITMLFDKDADLKDLKRIAKAALEDKWPDPKKRPKNLRIPFRDGAEKDYEGYEGKIFARASSKMRPGLVDRNLQAIIDPNDFYPGCYARATITAFAYDTKGNRGVAFGLSNVQKLRDGESFSGRVRAEEDFDELPELDADKGVDMGSDDGGDPLGLD